MKVAVSSATATTVMSFPLTARAKMGKGYLSLRHPQESQ